ncbi:MAG: ABC transporter permease, partial [Verrucomicrobia bacterium]|nr:ABC transporter permease [Verrucomicrobiota bacterium]
MNDAPSAQGTAPLAPSASARAGFPRADYLRASAVGSDFGVVEKPITVWARLYQVTWLRKLVILVLLAVLWQVYAQRLNNSLLVPTFGATIEAMIDGFRHGNLLERALFSLKVLLMGYSLGIALAGLFSMLAITFRLGNDLLETLTSMFNPLPAIALLPLA